MSQMSRAVAVPPLANVRALVVAGESPFFRRKESGKNARFRVDFVKKHVVFARTPTFSPRFNLQVASRADAKRVLRIWRASVNLAPETLNKSEYYPLPRRTGSKKSLGPIYVCDLLRFSAIRGISPA
jgi:hypothetical protein